MSNESAADVFASFGATSVVLTHENIDDHRQDMLGMNVDVRDGDDSIELVKNDDTGISVKDNVEDPYGQEDRTEIQVGLDPEDTEVDPEENHEEVEQGEEDLGEQLGDAPDELVSASQQIAEYADGLAQMKAQAIENGLPPEVAAQIEAEYEKDSKLSEASLKALEEAGFKASFVKSFLQGQESLATAYVNGIVEYAGGKAQWDVLIGHLSNNSPETIEVLEDAIQRQDLRAVKATINLAKASHKAKFGAKPARNVTSKAPSVTPRPAAKPQVQGFKSSDEMVRAMSDKRYATDPVYRNEVRAKVAAM